MSILRILHVDDEAAVNTVFRIILERTGRYVVREESSGARAIETAREFRPDLILLDRDLDGSDGQDVAARLQEDPVLRGVPIGFVTGGMTKLEASRQRIHTLAKPVSPTELLGFVDDLVHFHEVCAGAA